MTISRALITVTLLVTGWLLVLVGVTLLDDAAPAVLVLFPSSSFLSELPNHIAVLDITPVSITLASENTHIAAQLYQIGAKIVLPAGLSSCSSEV